MTVNLPVQTEMLVISVNSLTTKADRWSKSDKTQNTGRCLGNKGLNVDRDDPSDISQAVSAVTRDYLIQLFIEQSNLHYMQNVDK